MKRPSKTKSASRASRRSAPNALASTRLCADPIKDERLRRWAAKIASDLPSGGDDALRVLDLAKGLINWADNGEAPPSPSKRGRSAR